MVLLQIQYLIFLPQIILKISFSRFKEQAIPDKPGWEAAVAWTPEDKNATSQGRARKIFATSAEKAEGYAVWWAIKENISQYKSILIRSDCENVVKSLNSPETSSVEQVWSWTS
ncbi:uncharacterized protein LOC110719958 [Chenopodium quinoa]|uniref:uncharacterized protein LOC110719958 n=1 Tax=Chenopodium quinoa TaxID=63459 RepID=UPI000B78EA79|nr:uncharacterized protein LOC110719958 [Chenopodium quinoa]